MGAVFSNPDLIFSKSPPHLNLDLPKRKVLLKLDTHSHPASHDFAAISPSFPVYLRPPVDRDTIPRSKAPRSGHLNADCSQIPEHNFEEFHRCLPFPTRLPARPFPLVPRIPPSPSTTNTFSTTSRTI